MKNGQYHRYYPCVNLKFFNLPHVFYQAVKFYRMGLALPFSCILNVVYRNGIFHININRMYKKSQQKSRRYVSIFGYSTFIRCRRRYLTLNKYHQKIGRDFSRCVLY